MMEKGESAFSMVGDISKAHRRFKHLADEHGYLACQLDGDGPDSPVYINKVGTFGVNCASYWLGQDIGGGPSGDSPSDRPLSL